MTKFSHILQMFIKQPSASKKTMMMNAHTTIPSSSDTTMSYYDEDDRRSVSSMNTDEFEEDYERRRLEYLYGGPRGQIPRLTKEYLKRLETERQMDRMIKEIEERDAREALERAEREEREKKERAERLAREAEEAKLRAAVEEKERALNRQRGQRPTGTSDEEKQRLAKIERVEKNLRPCMHANCHSVQRMAGGNYYKNITGRKVCTFLHRNEVKSSWKKRMIEGGAFRG